MDVTVASNTRLVLLHVREGLATFAEFYANWDTGIRWTAPQGVTSDEVAALWREKVAA